MLKRQWRTTSFFTAPFFTAPFFTAPFLPSFLSLSSFSFRFSASLSFLSQLSIPSPLAGLRSTAVLACASPTLHKIVLETQLARGLVPVPLIRSACSVRAGLGGDASRPNEAGVKAEEWPGQLCGDRTAEQNSRVRPGEGNAKSFWLMRVAYWLSFLSTMRA